MTSAPYSQPGSTSAPAATESGSRRTSIDRWIVGGLIVAAVAPFLATLLFGYVYDDTAIVRGNPVIQGWRSLLTLWTEPYWPNNGSDRSGLYRPVTMALFAVIWNAGHRFAIWFHLFVVVMHATATLLVWRLLRRGAGRWAAAGAAIWFAVHPVHVEAVANISNSSEILVAVWTSLLALLLANRITPASALAEPRERWSTALLAATLYACALLTKESGVMAPALAVCWWWGWRARAVRPTIRRSDWTPTIVLWTGVLLAVVGIRRVVLGGVVSGVSIAAPGLDALSVVDRVWAMLSLGGRVLRLLVWPGVQNPHYGPSILPSTSGPTLAAGVTVLALALAISGAAWIAWRHRSADRRPLAALLWALIAFLPASNLLAATGQVLAERTLYVSSIGVAMLVAWGLDLAFARARTLETRRSFNARTVGAVLAATLVVVASGWGAARVWHYAAVWGSHDRLFRQMVTADTMSYRGHQLLAREAARAHRAVDAEQHLARAYALYPRDRQTLISYSELLLEQGRPVEAVRFASQLMLHTDLRTDRGAVGLYLESTGRAWGADSVLAAGRRLFATSPSATAALFIGLAQETHGDTAGALASYRLGLRLAPADSALAARAAVLAARG